MSDKPTIEIPRDIIEPIVQARITSMVAEALAPRGQLIEKAVATVLSTKVDDKGVVQSSDYYNKIPWLEWAMGDCIKIAVRKALEEEVSKHQEQMKQIIIRQLKAKNSPLLTQLAEAMVGGFTHKDTLSYRLTVAVKGYRDS